MIVSSLAHWGFPGWTSTPTTVPASARDSIMLHHDGDAPVRDVGPATMKRIDREHRGRGWFGIGYNFVIDQDACVWEGRGWSLQGAHCPGWNRRAIGVQMAVGAGQVETEAMRRAFVDLALLMCDITGGLVEVTTHGAHYPTECPGKARAAWARTLRTPGPPAVPTAAKDHKEEDGVMTPGGVWERPVPTGELGSDGDPLTMEWMLVRTYNQVRDLRAEVLRLGDEVAALREAR